MGEDTASQGLPWLELHRRATVVDMHAHPSLKVSLFRRSLARAVGSSRHLWPLSFRTNATYLRDGGVDVVLSAIYPPEHGLRDEFWPIHLLRFLLPVSWCRYYAKPYFNVTERMMAELESEAQKYPADLQVVRNSEQLTTLLGQPAPRPVALIHCLEGAHCLDGNLDHLKTLADRGVAYVTLAHFYQNEFAPPCYPFDEKLNRPGLFDQERDLTRTLTKQGEDLVRCMGDLGVVVDVAHCTPVTRRRVYEVTPPSQCLIASHVGAYAINPAPYNLTDEEIRLISDRGGVVSVIFMNYWLAPYETSQGINEIVQTIRHLVRKGGVECVALGTDFDGFTDPPDDLKDAREMPRLTSRLVAEGFSQADIERMLGGNAMRVLQESWRSGKCQG
jgi:membrane dipeptidase